jgi:hypothetical protein
MVVPTAARELPTVSEIVVFAPDISVVPDNVTPAMADVAPALDGCAFSHAEEVQKRGRKPEMRGAAVPGIGGRQRRLPKKAQKEQFRRQ